MTNHSYHCAYGSSNSNGFTDLDKWEDHTLTSGSLYMYLLNDTTTSLKYYKTILEKYSKLYSDQWDYRILSHYYGYNPNDTNKALFGIDLPGSDAFNSPHVLPNQNYTLCWEMCNNTQGCMAWSYQPPRTTNGCSGYSNLEPYCWLKSAVPAENPNICITSGIEPSNLPQLAPSRPACTSHYDRQLIGYSFILATTGQKFDARHGIRRLSVSPKQELFHKKGDCIPILIPGASSLLCKVDGTGKCFEMKIMFGELKLDELKVYDAKIPLTNKLHLMRNDRKIVCH